MDDNLDERELKEFEEQIAEDLGYAETQTNIRQRKSHFNFNTNRRAILFAVLGIFILIFLFVLFSGDDDEERTADLTSVEQRIEKVEKTLACLETIQGRIAFLESQEKGFQQSVEAKDKSVTSLSQRLDTLCQRFEKLEKEISTNRKKIEAQSKVTEKASFQDKNQYHEVRSGETLYRIAMKYRATVSELCRLNNIKPDSILRTGQRLLVATGND